MAISLGTLVTLLIRKIHPNGETLSSGISGMVLQANPNPTGPVRYVVDFGAEGQWNCEESELGIEGLIQSQEREDRPRETTPRVTTFSGEGMPPAVKEKGVSPEKVLSFEEEMAILEGSEKIEDSDPEDEDEDNNEDEDEEEDEDDF